MKGIAVAERAPTISCGTTARTIGKPRPEHWKFYATPEWKKNIRISVLKRDKYTCQICGKPGNVVDHIVPHRGVTALQMDTDNCQCLCLSCHGRKSRAERSAGQGGVNS